MFDLWDSHPINTISLPSWNPLPHLSESGLMRDGFWTCVVRLLQSLCQSIQGFGVVSRHHGFTVVNAQQAHQRAVLLSSPLKLSPWFMGWFVERLSLWVRLEVLATPLV